MLRFLHSAVPKVVVVGGGPAGRVIVHSLFHAKKQFDVTLIKEEKVNANRCAIPYGIDQEKVVMKYAIPNALITDFGAKLMVDKVSEVDRMRKIVRTMEGGDVPYDQLVIATGSLPIVPPFDGLGPVPPKNLTTVRGLDDLQLLREFAPKSRKVVVIGGGYIGLEVAVTLKRLGLEVSIVEMLPHVLLATMEEEFALDIEKHVLENGLNLHVDSKVVGFERKGDVITGVKLGDGKTLDADLVVMSVGVKPNTILAQQAGLATSPFGISVDDSMRSVTDESIFAVGDCAAKKSFVSKKPTRGEFGTNAVFMAKTAAMNILGKKDVFPGVLNANVSTAFDYSFGSVGLTSRAAEGMGLPIVTGSSDVLDVYPMMENPTPIRTKLVFNRETKKLVGATVLRKRGRATSGNVDFYSMAIQMGASLNDLINLQYATHPELAAKPSDNTVLFAAKDALSKL
jgi:NADH oxidase (H2O2-forming)